MHSGGYLVSAIFLCLEYWRLGIEHRRRHVILFVSFWIKLVFIVVEFGLAIAFGICDKTDYRANSAAILEWGEFHLSFPSSCGVSDIDHLVLNCALVISLIFTFYVLSFVIDLLPAVRTRHHIPQGEKELRAEYANGSYARNNLAYEQPLTTDSMGQNGNSYRGQVVNNHSHFAPSQNRRVLDV